jgi:hypothetical protein
MGHRDISLQGPDQNLDATVFLLSFFAEQITLIHLLYMHTQELSSNMCRVYSERLNVHRDICMSWKNMNGLYWASDWKVGKGAGSCRASGKAGPGSLFQIPCHENWDHTSTPPCRPPSVQCNAHASWMSFFHELFMDVLFFAVNNSHLTSAYRFRVSRSRKLVQHAGVLFCTGLYRVKYFVLHPFLFFCGRVVGESETNFFYFKSETKFSLCRYVMQYNTIHKLVSPIDFIWNT